MKRIPCAGAANSPLISVAGPRQQTFLTAVSRLIVNQDIEMTERRQEMTVSL